MGDVDHPMSCCLNTFCDSAPPPAFPQILNTVHCLWGVYPASLECQFVINFIGLTGEEYLVGLPSKPDEVNTGQQYFIILSHSRAVKVGDEQGR